MSDLNKLEAGIADFQNEYGQKWWPAFAQLYMNQKRTCDLTESCVLQSLTPEVGRSDEAIRGLFETELLKIIEVANKDTTKSVDQDAHEKTWVNLAMLIGGVTLARAVKDEVLADKIAQAIR